jgi:hypothetical protein
MELILARLQRSLSYKPRKLAALDLGIIKNLMIDIYRGI